MLSNTIMRDHLGHNLGAQCHIFVGRVFPLFCPVKLRPTNCLAAKWDKRVTKSQISNWQGGRCSHFFADQPWCAHICRWPSRNMLTSFSSCLFTVERKTWRWLQLTLMFWKIVKGGAMEGPPWLPTMGDGGSLGLELSFPVPQHSPYQKLAQIWSMIWGCQF